MARTDTTPPTRVELLRQASDLCMTSTLATALSRESYLAAVTPALKTPQLTESQVTTLLTLRDHLITLLTRAAADELEKWIEKDGISKKLELLDRISAMGVTDGVEEFEKQAGRKVAREELIKVKMDIQNVESRLILKNARLKEMIEQLEMKKKN